MLRHSATSKSKHTIFLLSGINLMTLEQDVMKRKPEKPSRMLWRNWKLEIAKLSATLV
jgi:hypothetical protein